MNAIHLSVVIPAYNEEHRITPTIQAVAMYLSQQKYTSEILVVLNNCTDRTLSVVQSLQKEIPSLRYIDLGLLYKPAGTKGLAVEKGMLEAKGEYRIYLDADNAAEIMEIEKLWPAIERGVEVVFGSRYLSGSHASVSFLRRVLSRIGNLIIRSSLLPGIEDTQCAFKLFTKKAAVAIFSRTHIAGWGFDIEALFVARYLGFTWQEVAISWTEKQGSSVKPSAFLKTLLDLVAIRTRAWTGGYE